MPPNLRHSKRGRQKTWNGVALRGSELPGPGFNSASCLTPTPPLAELLPVAREFFADADKGWGVLVEGDAGHPVEAELIAAGWKVDEDEPAFVMPDIRDGLQPDKPPPAGLVVRPVRTEADRATFERVCAAAFNAPPELGSIIMPSLAYATDPEMCWLIGERNGEPVACGGLTSRTGRPSCAAWPRRNHTAAGGSGRRSRGRCWPTGRRRGVRTRPCGAGRRASRRSPAAAGGRGP